MLEFYSKEEALRKLRNEGVIWLALTDIHACDNDRDTFYWDCLPFLDMSKRGSEWHDAELIDSPNGISILESALSMPYRNAVFILLITASENIKTRVYQAVRQEYA